MISTNIGPTKTLTKSLLYKKVFFQLLFHLLSPVASAPTGLTAVREGPTGIRVSWTPPTPLGDTTGYRIYYSGGSSGSENVSDVSTDNLLLTGLQNGASYTISIVGTSNHLNSDHVNHQNNITLSESFKRTKKHFLNEQRSK